MLHSLVPAYAQSKTDGRYGLRQLGGLATGSADKHVPRNLKQGDFDLLIVDQDLDKAHTGV